MEAMGLSGFPLLTPGLEPMLTSRPESLAFPQMSPVSVPDIITPSPSLPRERSGLGAETLKASSVAVVLLPGN